MHHPSTHPSFMPHQPLLRHCTEQGGAVDGRRGGRLMARTLFNIINPISMMDAVLLVGSCGPSASGRPGLSPLCTAGAWAGAGGGSVLRRHHPRGGELPEPLPACHSILVRSRWVDLGASPVFHPPPPACRWPVSEQHHAMSPAGRQHPQFYSGCFYGPCPDELITPSPSVSRGG